MTKLSVACIINGDTPKAIIENNIFNFGFKNFFLILRILCFPNKKYNTHIAEAH